MGLIELTFINEKSTRPRKLKKQSILCESTKDAINHIKKDGVEIIRADYVFPKDLIEKEPVINTVKKGDYATIIIVELESGEEKLAIVNNMKEFIDEIASKRDDIYGFREIEEYSPALCI